MRRRLHNWFGWHAWVEIGGAKNADIGGRAAMPVYCKCGVVGAIALERGIAL